MNQSAPLRVLDPRSFPVVKSVSVPRLGSVTEARIGFLWNNRPRGDLILRGLAKKFEDELRAETVFTNKLRVGTGASDEELGRLVGKVDAVVVGIGD